MKRVLAAVLSLLVLCGCGSSVEKNENESVPEVTRLKTETPDSAFEKESPSEPEKDSESDSDSEDDSAKEKKKCDSDAEKTSSKSGRSDSDSSVKGGKSHSSDSDSESSTEVRSDSSKTGNNNSANSIAAVNNNTNANVNTNTNNNTEYNGNEAQSVQTTVGDGADQNDSNDSEANSVQPEEENSQPEFKDPYERFDSGNQVDLSWFDDCVFVGDSLTVGLEAFNDSTGALGKAAFICSVGLNYGNSQWDLYDPNNVHPMYNGTTVLAEDAGVVTGAKKAIVGMGINDIAVWNPQRGVENARGLIEKIKAKSPEMEIYLQSVNPMVSYAQKSNLSNDLINEFNDGLRQLADEEGCGFINSHDIFTDSSGSLPDWLCSDPNNLGIHLTSEANAIWADYIKSSVG